MRTLGLFVSLMLCLAPASAWGDDTLADRNGDGAVEILAFGDSITYGVGDGIASGIYVEGPLERGAPRGWPLRLSALTGTSVVNAGVPGEELVGSGEIESGVDRLPSLVVGGTADLVIIKEGANDAEHFVSSRLFGATLQKAINVTVAEGKGVVLSTLAPPTGSHAQFAPFAAAYSNVVRDLGVINAIPVADVEAAFVTACPEMATCAYYNLPEGLHPNTLGYDAIASVMATALSQ
jgi:hypothetical protein